MLSPAVPEWKVTSTPEPSAPNVVAAVKDCATSVKAKVALPDKAGRVTLRSAAMLLVINIKL